MAPTHASPGADVDGCQAAPGPPIPVVGLPPDDARQGAEPGDASGRTRPWYRRARWWLLGAALAIAAAVAVAGRPDRGSDDDEVLGLGAAELEITNHSARRSDYLITVVVDSPSGSAAGATGLATVDRLPGGRTTGATARFTTSLPDGAEIVVKEVTRTASL
jgi:hypothetical protein